LIQGYVVTLVCSCHPRLVYHGCCYGDGITYETRTERELSGIVKVNARYKELLEEHGRHAFTVDKTGDFDSLYECLMDEAARIERDRSYLSEFGFNVERKDAKRLERALAEYTPGACQADLLAVAWEDFRRYQQEAFQPFDTPENEAIITDVAKKEPCSIATAFHLAREAGSLVPVPSSRGSS
jgi:hypothetical protein